ncbi:MAG TPA: DUF3499 family protein [Acidimicrobiales bacterium]|jgi:hypothetical protein
MARLCERPGCGESASVAYGFDAERGTVWLEALTPSAGPTGGVLCRRHADAIVLPKGWWLQDRRSDSTLFTATPAPAASTYRPKRPRRPTVTPPPLPLDPEPAGDAVDAPAAAWTPAFDAADDLGGLLAAKTPLLSRAFRQPIPPPSNA